MKLSGAPLPLGPPVTRRSSHPIVTPLTAAGVWPDQGFPGFLVPVFVCASFDGPRFDGPAFVGPGFDREPT